MRRTGQPRRKAQKTLLIMGEGLCDESFLKHVKSIYVQRRCGLAVTVRNARGKGPCNVIETAVRANAGSGFDVRAFLSIVI